MVSRNSFRQSHQRCIVVEGTSNLTMSENIGYQTHGHCIYIGYQSRFNKVTKNLVSDTKVVNNAIGPNDFTNNIAVGGINHQSGEIFTVNCFFSNFTRRLRTGKLMVYILFHCSYLKLWFSG